MSRDVAAACEAAKELYDNSRLEDRHALLTLLQHDDFFVREAAAWPLCSLGVTTALPQLFVAFQRGFNDVHDNDGFSTAVIEMASLHKESTRLALEEILTAGDDPSSVKHAQWLLEFCA